MVDGTHLSESQLFSLSFVFLLCSFLSFSFCSGCISLDLSHQSPRSAGWSWRLELEWCERKILLGWLELVARVV